MKMRALFIARLALVQTGFLVLLALSLISACAATSPRQCLPAEERAADEVAGRLASWTDLYNAYQRFSHCDDGSIGEGFSESVSLLLVGSWDRIGELRRLIERDRSFETFVLKHIDATVPMERLDAIAKKAESQCSTDKSLCEKIAQRAHAR
jgi:hypothetical protein